MFEVPNAKRVRREDLQGSSSADEDDGSDEAMRDEMQEALRAQLSARLAQVLSVDLTYTVADDQRDSKQAPQAPKIAHEDGDEEGTHLPATGHEEEFEFRLFSTSKGSAPKVIITADEGEDGYQEGEGTILTRRPLSYYFKDSLSLEEKRNFEAAALSGAAVREAAKHRAWGLEVPWRVTAIGFTATKKSRLDDLTEKKGSAAMSGGVAEPGKRKRPGKKRRIALRTLGKAQKAKAALAEQQKMTKEEHLREKKKRLNRERKLKRKQKDKDKKLLAQAEGIDGQQEEGSASGDNSD